MFTTDLKIYRFQIHPILFHAIKVILSANRFCYYYYNLNYATFIFNYDKRLSPLVSCKSETYFGRRYVFFTSDEHVNY